MKNLSAGKGVGKQGEREWEGERGREEGGRKGKGGKVAGGVGREG